MNYGLILAGGTGQRMRTSGMPKQFLNVYGKPIIIYTIEKFDTCNDVDGIVVVCNPHYIDYMRKLIAKYPFSKEISVIPGGKDRQGSVKNGIDYIFASGADVDDLVIIHDGVRPLVDQTIISENVKTAARYGCAMTVKPVIESVVITDSDSVEFNNFEKRDDTYSLTAPQTFRLSLLVEIYKKLENIESPIPLLDAALAYTYLGNKIPLVKEFNHNIKITTPEDFYILKAILELQENKNVFGLI
jgi:2-C-methyl-D-erythritol 4-phosphate cytidylyltransferase